MEAQEAKTPDLDQLYLSLVKRVGWSAARVRLGELAAELDDSLTLCLAIHYGRDREQILSLLQDVFWRLLSLTRFDGHPPSGVLPREDVRSWRAWGRSPGGAGRSLPSSRRRSLSCASAGTGQWARSRRTST